jgi:regulator of protease activity HflC (stomatin/prohibitin superfamily)
MEEERFRLPGWAKALTWVGAIVIVLLIFWPFSCVAATDRAVRLRFGAVVSETAITPGLKLKAPLIERIRSYTIKPQQLITDIGVDEQSAITKDNQTIGVKVATFYVYEESRIVEIARNYTEDNLRQIVNKNAENAIKVVMGTYDIFEIARTQQETMGKVRALLTSNLSQYPVRVVDLKLINYNWSEEFDNQIAATMQKAQQVKQKEQELQVTQLEAQKQVKEAEALKQATITKAEGEKQRVALEAEAKVLEGEGIRKYNESLARTLEIQIKLRELDIEMERVQKWNGQYVPNNMYGPIPVQAGGIQGK